MRPTKSIFKPIKVVDPSTSIHPSIPDVLFLSDAKGGFLSFLFVVVVVVVSVPVFVSLMSCMESCAWEIMHM